MNQSVGVGNVTEMEKENSSKEQLKLCPGCSNTPERLPIGDGFVVCQTQGCHLYNKAFLEEFWNAKEEVR